MVEEDESTKEAVREFKEYYRAERTSTPITMNIKFKLEITHNKKQMRTCFNVKCDKELHYDDVLLFNSVFFITPKETLITKQDFDKIWDSEHVEFYCCKCMESEKERKEKNNKIVKLKYGV